MEANHLQDSKSSSEETDKSEQSIDNTRSGSRSYECLFCKRGFTTAQALGGHMNIHRKDRARSRPSSVPILVSGNQVDDENYPTLKSYSLSATLLHSSRDNSQHLNRSLSLRIGPSSVDDHRNNKADGSIEEDELDLELRLGHDP
ncbi:hypothetical protein V6N13_045984 [Hibiscus sabdariffa]|uniref:C2H2-type domain-containing protein n=1 Tax=Hibiscus sabdariffa TaxID=183260 RepID=A0ABR2A4J5_9ROSI